jgi:hypothetical protein
VYHRIEHAFCSFENPLEDFFSRESFEDDPHAAADPDEDRPALVASRVEVVLADLSSVLKRGVESASLDSQLERM